MTINHEKVAPLTHNYLPHHLKRKTLYAEITELLDYLIEKCYQPHVINMRDKLNPNGTGFDAQEFLNLIDGFRYKDQILQGVDIRTACHMLPRVYTLKGTKRGLQMLLNILGIKADIYIWWELKRKLGKDAEFTRKFQERFGALQANEVENCNIYLNLIDSGKIGSTLLDADIDEKLKALIETFMWVCASINAINLLRQLTTRISIKDILNHVGEKQWNEASYDSFHWRYDSSIGGKQDLLKYGLASTKYKHNQPDLVYNNGLDFPQTHNGYTFIESENRWTFGGSILNAIEDNSFKEQRIVVRGCLIGTIDNIERVVVEGHAIQTQVSSASKFGNSNYVQSLESRLSIQDNLLVTMPYTVRDSSTKELVIHDSSHDYHDGTNSKALKYNPPVRDSITLTDTLNFTITED